MAYIFHEDPAHGWLEVPKAELAKLGIADKISHYSYMSGDKAYLEEDCDLGAFIMAIGGIDAWKALDIDDVYHDSYAPMRSMASYRVNN